jgi:hypothetical protein
MRKKLPAAIAAAIAALLTVPGTYALLRAYDVLFRSEPNPATVAWSMHIAMFWRLAVASFVAGMVALAAYAAARRNLVRTLDALYVITFVAAAMIAGQGLALP